LQVITAKIKTTFMQVRSTVCQTFVSTWYYTIWHRIIIKRAKTLQPGDCLASMYL